MLVIDGADQDSLKSYMKLEIHYTHQRHKRGYSMMEMVASTAPALGLLGTYIGQIPMLENLENPTKLGPLMALELVTSFYGAFIAYVIFSPLAKRLKTMSAEELSRKGFLLEGILFILEGKNPKLIREELTACLSEAEISQNSNKRKHTTKSVKGNHTNVLTDIKKGA